jgi:hypothetical protein
LRDIWRGSSVKAVVASSVFICSAVVAGGALLYYLSLPAHTGPENSSPPPEGIGLIFGAALGCFLAVAGAVAFLRSVRRAVASLALVFAGAAAGWLALGAGTFGDRVGDCLLGLLLLGPAAAAGVMLGAVLLRLRGAGWRSRTR